MPALVFNGVSLSIIRQNNQTYFSASDIAKSLGYQSDDAISRIYRRNADEFTSDMSQTVNLTVSGNYQKTVRLFSLRGAHLVAMFSRTPIAKEFRKWVLDVLDRETSQRTLIQDIDVKSLLLENHFELTVLLTSRQLSSYSVHALEKNSVGFGRPVCKRRTPPQQRFFCVRNKPLMSGACGNPSGLPVSVYAGRPTRKSLLTPLDGGSRFQKLVNGGSHA
ncbi:BRO-N domain-containing protein [Oxalobacter formigenes]|uniref:BRO-N domain-containing protein n=1 Tax=Oxalobacter formigenes TaxID=847 RepID=UPI00241FB0F1|nr:Bro-N domain-containing protein [Oxalobacter formigenes]